MTATQALALLPFIVLTGGIVAVMLAIAVRRIHLVALLLTLVTLVAATATLPVSQLASSDQVTNLIVMDRYALYFSGLIFAAAFAVAVLAYRYLDGRPGNDEEFYLLLLLATLGSAVLGASTHFVSFFLGLEVLSVSLYALIGYPYNTEQSVEAATKYLVLAGVSSAFLLFGMALVYGELGTMQFGEIAGARRSVSNLEETILLMGFGLIVIGIGFKLAVVPFHMWTPDVYEGAPAPVTAFIATVSKGGMFALLLRFYRDFDYHSFHSLFVAFAVVAVASMIAGNLLALLQTNVKRILAYSSIAHLGYLLVAFLASGSLVVTAVSFYFVAYFAATVASFGIMTVLSNHERDADRIEDYRGLFWQRPWLAAGFSAALFSLAGLPLTAGFLGKIYLVAAGADSAMWWLIIILVVTSVIGLFYYLRIIAALYVHAGEEAEPPITAGARVSLADNAVLASVLGVLLWLGVYPAPLIHLIETFSR